MIFYHPQLMQNESEAKLFMVINPVAFKNFEDHEAAIFIQLHDLVEKAIKQKESPVSLIEDYLNVTYTGGHSFLFR